MGKKIKKLSLSKSAVIGCLIAATAFTTLGAQVYGEEITSTSNETQISETTNKHEFLIDSKFKYYDNLEKAEKISGFSFKVPDYKINNYIADGGIIVRKINDSENYVSLQFDNTDEKAECYGYYLEMFNENPKDAYKKVYENDQYVNVDITGTEKTIGNIKGEDITIVENYIDYEEGQSISKVFAWEDEGIYYTINYNEKQKIDNEWNEVISVNEDEISKIASSMKKPEDITNVKYFEQNAYGVPVTRIYDKEDLENASKDLGFEPKFIKDINDEIHVKDALVVKSKNNKIRMQMNYRDKDNHYVILTETNDSEKYNEMKNDKLRLYEFDENCKPSKAEKLTINNREVYKIKEKVDERYANASNECNYLYMWEENGVYYKVNSYCQDAEFDNGIESMISDIIKQL